jgi:hypothetical protein
LYSEGECFHVVIIADWELLVNHQGYTVSRPRLTDSE